MYFFHMHTNEDRGRENRERAEMDIQLDICWMSPSSTENPGFTGGIMYSNWREMSEATKACGRKWG